MQVKGFDQIKFLHENWQNGHELIKERTNSTEMYMEKALGITP